jgi:HK97 family phage prohead protease
MAKSSTLYRSSVELHVEGRTLIGVAMPWDTPALVRDLTGPAYYEAFAPQSFDKTLEQRPEPRPVFVTHEHLFVPAAEPIGVSAFTRSASALLYQAHLSRTRKADEYLELVRDGAMGDASVGFRPVNHTRRQLAGRDTVYRTEALLRELSIAPTGFGQYPQAKTLAIRSVPDGMPFSEVSEAVEDALEAKLFPATGEEPEGVYLWVRDLSDTWVVYSVCGAVSEEQEGIWQASYSMDASGVVTVGDSQQVRVAYVPLESDAPSARSETPRRDRIATYRRRAGF